jgi:putative flippase GtrA
VRRLIKYSATSAIALGVSELTLVILYATAVNDAAAASIIASITGTVPSYLLSRYWIWADADRTRVGRQVTLYWLTSIVSMVLTSGAMALVADAAPKGRRVHVIIVGIAFVVVSAVLWIGKYVVYHTVIFPGSRQPAREPMVAPDAEISDDRVVLSGSRVSS